MFKGESQEVLNLSTHFLFLVSSIHQIFQEHKKLKKIMSSSNSPCAACKFLRRKCTEECVFAPYFPPDNPQKFANVHKVFGASNVSKLLNELEATQREDAVQSLAYEAEFRLRDPVYGCVGLISGLQHKLQFIKRELAIARKELAGYIGPTALLPIQNREMILQLHLNNNNPSAAGMFPSGMQPMAEITLTDPEHQQGFLEAQQQMVAAVAAREQQELIRRYEHEQQQQRQQEEEVARFNNVGYGGPSEVVTATGYNGMHHQEPCLALGGYESSNSYHHQIQQDVHHQEHQHMAQSLYLQSQLMLNQQQPQHHPQSHHHLQHPQHYQQHHHHLQQSQQDQQQSAKTEERFSAGGPSS